MSHIFHLFLYLYVCICHLFSTLHADCQSIGGPILGHLRLLLQKSAFSYCSTSRLALGSPGWLFGWSVGRHHARNTLKTLIMLYFWKAKGPRTSKMIFWNARYTNTQIQIHKNSNTACDEVRKYPTCVIFLRSQGSKDIKHDILDCQIHIWRSFSIVKNICADVS